MIERTRKYWQNINDTELIEKGIEYALNNTGINRKELKNYCKGYSWDKRYRIEIVAVKDFKTKIDCSGICKYKDKVYLFFYTEKYSKIMSQEITY